MTIDEGAVRAVKVGGEWITVRRTTFSSLVGTFQLERDVWAPPHAQPGVWWTCIAEPNGERYAGPLDQIQAVRLAP